MTGTWCIAAVYRACKVGQCNFANLQSKLHPLTLHYSINLMCYSISRNVKQENSLVSPNNEKPPPLLGPLVYAYQIQINPSILAKSWPGYLGLSIRPPTIGFLIIIVITILNPM